MCVCMYACMCLHDGGGAFMFLDSIAFLTNGVQISWKSTVSAVLALGLDAYIDIDMDMDRCR